MKTILIVDDDPNICFLLNLDLANNYKILEAANGLEALDLFHKHNPDLIITSYRMPMLDGIDFIKSIRELDSYVKIIAHSSLLHSLKEADFLAAGANLCLPKPASFSHLQQAIFFLLQQHHFAANSSS